MPLDEAALRELLEGVFARPEMEEACERRDLGAVIRVLNKYGVSQGSISVLTGIAQGRLSEYKNGKRIPTAHTTFESMAAGLGMPTNLRRALGLAPVNEPNWVDHASREKSLPADVATSQGEWLHTRSRLNEHRSDLTRLARDLYPSNARLEGTAILMADGWRPEEPIELDALKLSLADTTPHPPVTGKQGETNPLRPLVSTGKRYDSYHRAMRDLASPRLFENRVCYRLLDFEQSAGEGQLSLGLMRYFDMIDVGESLAHELASVAVGRDNLTPHRATWANLPFRRLVRDPFALQNYPLLISISTMTIRRSNAGDTFVMLRRGVERVAIAGGMLSVMPTGVFQPASLLPGDPYQDLNLWNNMMREYSEEFLGNPEHDGSGDPIDYDNQEPFRSLNRARDAGKIRTLCLGVGIDALNMVGDVFTVAVFDADVFDDIFRDLVEDNEEGSVASSGNNREHFAFDEQTITHLLENEPIAPSGAACLTLAWHHRSVLLR
ncbi:helix-turn-helix transcriptional regulator [Actinomadura barringtoniae]|uniref:Helix-turn-helix transcriptional regulator n=1 Tax=Actinomadura barringtoniae TaxID=1427535 RepID=A0A939PAK7_9ACTN|nr:helix-turn-helix transcriptional regulator [Actinomadura barringtoniae]MBO2449040.1 helix-turn-helix transcriptional regulator [Actinomadura barringtoniae]